VPEHSEPATAGPPVSPKDPPGHVAAPPVALKDPLWAGFLAWLLPGLGHAYQGRYPKAVLFFVTILGTFVYGVYLGSDNGPETAPVGWGRVVYFSLRTQQRAQNRTEQGDVRWSYFGQAGVGLAAVPALFQAYRMSRGEPPLCHALMAPPKINAADPPVLDAKDPGQRTLREVLYDLDRYFELGTIYTVIAGLLNILAIYDACCGPVLAEPAKKKDDDKPTDQADKKDEAEKPA
jgi:hypothetical protein